MPTYPDLQNKTVLITGGANGLGAAMVRAFAAQGAIVHFCDIDEECGAALMSAHPGSTHFTAVDLTKVDQLKSWIDTAAAPSGRIEVLVNNAARDPRIALEDMTPQEWDDLIALNLRAYFFAAQAAAPHMPADGSAAIVNFSSITFHLAPPDVPAYVATKSGIIGLTRTLARALGPEQRIRVNTLSPGWIMTERQVTELVTPEIEAMLQREQAIPDLIQPEEIAEVALFLSSTASSAITGQELLADRGWRFS